MECKLRCGNFRRVSDHRRGFRPAFRVTGNSDNCYRGDCNRFGNTSDHHKEHWVHLAAPGGAGNKSESADDMPENAWEHQQQAWEHLGAQATSLGAPRITTEQSGKTTSALEMLLICPEIIATTYHSTIFETHGFILYYHLCIYIATDLHTAYLDWLPTTLGTNSRCA